MTVKFADSETKKNLMKAFAGESQARTRYTFFASKANKEGYKQIQDIFLETAANEKEHAEIFYKHLVSRLEAENSPVMVEFEAGYPVILSSSTEENLLAAAAGEQEEWEELYPAFAAKAKEEGYQDIAQSFLQIAKVEAHHMKRYQALAQNVRDGKVFAKEEKVFWKCRNCGYIMEAKDAPALCPACHHPKDYFEVQAMNW